MDKRTVIILLCSLGLAVMLLVVGFRLDQHLSSVENQLIARAPGAPPLQAPDATPETISQSQTVYVPVYSHIYSDRGRLVALETTLSIRNTDPQHTLVVRSVRYYDNHGQMLREFLETPAALGPLASTEFLIQRRDLAGGVGANFLVDWVSEHQITPPLIETVMVSTAGNKAFAFARSGVALNGPPAALGGEPPVANLP